MLCWAQRLDDAPLVQVGVLELVHDDERVPAAVEAPQRGAALQQDGGDRRELVEDVGPAAGEFPGLGGPVAVVVGLARVLHVGRQEHRRSRTEPSASSHRLKLMLVHPNR